jgi:type IV pilus assembly protein PilE
MSREETKMANPRQGCAGFSLIEIVVAVAIVAIIAAIAIPSYKDKVYKGRRADAKTALADLANRMESYYARNNTYATATIATGASATDVLSSATSAGGSYTLSIVPAGTTATTYRIQAVPAGLQAGDALCGTLSITSGNVKAVTGTGTLSECW